MTAVIVPNHISDALNRLIDTGIANLPLEEQAIVEAERAEHYHTLLQWYLRIGEVPKILSFTKKPK